MLESHVVGSTRYQVENERFEYTARTTEAYSNQNRGHTILSRGGVFGFDSPFAPSSADTGHNLDTSPLTHPLMFLWARA